MTVAIIDYGAGNLTSLRYAIQRCGVDNVWVTAESDVIRAAERVIFPGVGHAKYAMEQLKLTGLHTLIPRLVQPVLGICLGMQLMCLSSQEGEVEGLGIFGAKVRRFEGSIKVPHMGWNTVYGNVRHPEINDYYYFVHSYYADLCDDTMAFCDYGLRFSAMLAKGNFIGCQFHPEKSGAAGEHFLKKFLS